MPESTATNAVSYTTPRDTIFAHPAKRRCGKIPASEEPLCQSYFHLRHATGVSVDKDGIDLPDASVARQEALISAHEITREMLVVDALSMGDAVLEVVDDTGETIVIVSFRDAAALPALPMDRDVHRHRVSMIGTRH